MGDRVCHAYEGITGRNLGDSFPHRANMVTAIGFVERLNRETRARTNQSPLSIIKFQKVDDIQQSAQMLVAEARQSWRGQLHFVFCKGSPGWFHQKASLR